MLKKFSYNFKENILNIGTIAISLVLIGILEKFFQILEAGFPHFQGCSYVNLALGRDRGPWQLRG